MAAGRRGVSWKGLGHLLGVREKKYEVHPRFKLRKQGGWWCHSLSFRLQVVWRECGLMFFPSISVLPVGTLRDQEHGQISSATYAFLNAKMGEPWKSK